MKRFLASPFLLLISASLAFSIMNAAVKALDRFSVWQVVFFRSLFGVVWFFPLVAKNFDKWKVSGRQSVSLIIRSIFGFVSISLYFYAIEHLPLTKAVLYNYSFPLFVLLFSVLFLNEKIGFRSLLSMFVAFLGVAVVVRFDGDFSSGGFWANVGGITSALTAGVSIVAMKVATRYTSPYYIVFFFMTVAACLSAVPTALTFVVPNPMEWALLLMVGVFGTGAQALMTKGFAGLEASTGGVAAMATVVFSSFLGWLIWAEPVDLQTVLGGFLVGLGIYGAYRLRV